MADELTYEDSGKTFICKNDETEAYKLPQAKDWEAGAEYFFSCQGGTMTVDPFDSADKFMGLPGGVPLVMTGISHLHVRLVARKRWLIVTQFGTVEA